MFGDQTFLIVYELIENIGQTKLRYLDCAFNVSTFLGVIFYKWGSQLKNFWSRSLSLNFSFEFFYTRKIYNLTNI